MGKIIRDESTPLGRELWEAIDNAAARAPDWMKDRVTRIYALGRVCSLVGHSWQQGECSVCGGMTVEEIDSIE